MSILKANGLKLFLGVSCLLLVLSLIFSAYSYAKYVTNAGVDADSVGTASIDCAFSVSNGGVGCIH